MALPALARTMLPRLYERRSLVRIALTSMGMVLAAKITVETAPARSGMLIATCLTRCGWPWL